MLDSAHPRAAVTAPIPPGALLAVRGLTKYFPI
jgi:hypothetical protein